MTVKHIRKNYQSGPKPPTSPDNGMKAPSAGPTPMRAMPAQMMPQKMLRSGNESGTSKSWMVGLFIILLLIIMACLYFMNKKKGPAMTSYFY